MFFCTFEDAEHEFLGATPGKCGELPLEGVFQNGRQNHIYLYSRALNGMQMEQIDVFFYGFTFRNIKNTLLIKSNAEGAL